MSEETTGILFENKIKELLEDVNGSSNISKNKKQLLKNTGRWK